MASDFKEFPWVYWSKGVENLLTIFDSFEILDRIHDFLVFLTLLTLLTLERTRWRKLYFFGFNLYFTGIYLPLLVVKSNKVNFWSWFSIFSQFKMLFHTVLLKNPSRSKQQEIFEWPRLLAFQTFKLYIPRCQHLLIESPVSERFFFINLFKHWKEQNRSLPW